MKYKLIYWPEFFLIGGSLFSFVINISSITPIIIIILTSILLIWKNKIYALILATVIGAICLYMIIALWSELNEFPNRTIDYWKMFFTGHFLFLSTFISVICMPKKYFKIKTL